MAQTAPTNFQDAPKESEGLVSTE